MRRIPATSDTIAEVLSFVWVGASPWVFVTVGSVGGAIGVGAGDEDETT